MQQVYSFNTEMLMNEYKQKRNNTQIIDKFVF